MRVILMLAVAGLVAFVLQPAGAAAGDTTMTSDDANSNFP